MKWLTGVPREAHDRGWQCWMVNHVTTGLRLWVMYSNLTSQPPRRKGWLETEFSHTVNNQINHRWWKSQLKTLDELPGWWTHQCAGMLACSDSIGRKHGNSAFGTLHGPCPKGLFFGLFLIRKLYNKTLILSIVFSWVLWVILPNYWTQGAIRNHWIYNQFNQKHRWPQAPELSAGVW